MFLKEASRGKEIRKKGWREGRRNKGRESGRKEGWKEGGWKEGGWKEEGGRKEGVRMYIVVRVIVKRSTRLLAYLALFYLPTARRVEIDEIYEMKTMTNINRQTDSLL